MQRTCWSTALLASCFLVAIAAQDRSKTSAQLQGVWRVTEVTTTGTSGRHIPDHRPGLLFITGKHLSLVVEAGDKARPVEPPATVEAFREVWGPLVVFAGTYEASANELTVSIAVHKSPANMRAGSFMTWTYAVDGNKLTLVTLRTHEGPSKNPITWIFTRVE